MRYRYGTSDTGAVRAPIRKWWLLKAHRSLYRFIFSICSSHGYRSPASKEKHLAYTVMRIREWLEKRVVHEIVWIDTRSMVCDGLTKGSVNRFDLVQLLDTGTWSCAQADTAKRWKPKHA